MTAIEVKDALRRRHGSRPGEWICIEEAFSGWTTAGGGCDLLAVGVWASAKAPGLPGVGRRPYSNPVVAYEVKVSRSDFRRELWGQKPAEVPPQMQRFRYRPRTKPCWPEKNAQSRRASNYFLFAVPAGLLTPEEYACREKPEEWGKLWLPPGDGLLEVHADRCRVVVQPDPTKVEPWSQATFAEVLRHVGDPSSHRQMRQNNIYLQGEVERLRKQHRGCPQPTYDHLCLCWSLNLDGEPTLLRHPGCPQHPVV